MISVDEYIKLKKGKYLTDKDIVQISVYISRHIEQLTKNEKSIKQTNIVESYLLDQPSALASVDGEFSYSVALYVARSKQKDKAIIQAIKAARDALIVSCFHGHSDKLSNEVQFYISSLKDDTRPN